MLAEFLVILGAAGIALIIFVTIATLADQPVNAFITALTLSYALFFTYIYALNRILNRREKTRQEGQHHL
jgi:membrane protein implicated in regulation of membrane protease activity